MCLGCGTAVMQVYGSSGRVCCQGPVSTAWMCADAAATHEHVGAPCGPVNCCLGFCPSPSVCTWCRCTAGWELSSENRPALDQPCSTVHTPRVHIHAHALPLAAHAAGSLLDGTLSCRRANDASSTGSNGSYDVRSNSLSWQEGSAAAPAACSPGVDVLGITDGHHALLFGLTYAYMYWV